MALCAKFLMREEAEAGGGGGLQHLESCCDGAFLLLGED